MSSPAPKPDIFNPYIEQLLGDIHASGVNQGRSATPDHLKNWASLFLNAISIDADNVVANQTKLMLIAKILHDAGICLPLRPQEAPKLLTDQVLQTIAHQNFTVAAQIISLRFVFSLLMDGLQSGLARYAADYLSPDIGGADFAVTLPLMARFEWFDGITQKTAHQIFLDTPFKGVSPENIEILLVRAIRALNYHSTQRLETQHILTTALIVPWMDRLLKDENYSAALRLEGLLFENYVRRREEEQHYQRAHRLWAGMTENAGLKLRDKLGAPAPVLKPDEKPIVGFFIHRASMLAHIQLLYTALSGIPDLSALPYRVKIYAFSGDDPEMTSAFERLGAQVVIFKNHSPLDAPGIDRLLALREMMQQDGVVIMVWMCVLHMKGFVFGMGLAPRQIYWNAKYQVGAYNLPDDRITWHDNPQEQVEVDGKLWRSVPMTFSKLQHTLDQAKLAEERAKLPNWRLILGTMAREDILNSAPFLHTVAGLLKANPDIGYFYTGRENLQSIQAVFKEHGVIGQTKFVGWVDTVTYANLVDIYLDSWPARSGMTAFNVFEANKPFVSMILKDGGAIHKQFSSVPVIYDEKDAPHFDWKEFDAAFDTLDDGKRFFPVVTNDAEYREIAQRLIDDPDMRQKVGAAYGMLAERMSDASRAGNRLDAILRDNLRKTGAL